MNLFTNEWFHDILVDMAVIAPFDAATLVGRRERNKQEKLRRLIAAAQRLFAAKGFEAATIQEIAAAADIAAGTLYLYAASKEDLLILVSRAALVGLFEQAFAARRDEPLLDRLVRFFDVLIDYHAADTALARALMKQLAVMRSPQGRRDARHITLTLHDRLRDFVVEAQRAGELRSEAPIEVLVGNLYAIYRMQLQSWLNEFMTAAAFRAGLRASLDLQLAACRNEKIPGEDQAWPRARERSS